MEDKKYAKKFKFLEHTADIKFQAFGKDLEEQFENSALAMFHTMHDGKVKETKTKKIKVGGNDVKNLLYNFLEELLFLFETESFFLSRIESLEIDKKTLTLKAELIGDSSENYEIQTDIKAVTYNDMEINKEFVQVVVDT